MLQGTHDSSHEWQLGFHMNTARLETRNFQTSCCTCVPADNGWLKTCRLCFSLRERHMNQLSACPSALRKRHYFYFPVVIMFCFCCAGWLFGGQSFYRRLIAEFFYSSLGRSKTY
ncbi:hypothetical protein K443DRAFT_171424 [Laccaria amethystina LaAM-08-1]|uniref:Uncharacterized protein n=1 Tax=Laccaria amethystina LaAM-08-1 TaxID=1095629 RepID=A0A0C9WKL1_9AGAR|nr:hypothetical protein K443DRAFT_171424 [Laccaria amethystina LaAM-08-1]